MASKQESTGRDTFQAIIVHIPRQWPIILGISILKTIYVASPPTFRPSIKGRSVSPTSCPSYMKVGGQNPKTHPPADSATETLAGHCRGCVLCPNHAVCLNTQRTLQYHEDYSRLHCCCFSKYYLLGDCVRLWNCGGRASPEAWLEQPLGALVSISQKKRLMLQIMLSLGQR